MRGAGHRFQGEYMSAKTTKKKQEVSEETKQTIRQRKFALALMIVAGVIALACMVVCIILQKILWMVVFWLFIVAVIYFSKKQIENLHTLK